MKFCRIFLPLLSALFALTPVTASPQAPEPRLRSSIREDTRALLPGSMPPRLIGAQDLGPVAPDHPVQGITLVFRRSDTQEADLQQLLAAQTNPASPEFHHWLTPEAFGARFGMAESDLATTSAWLSAHGFQVTAVSHARDRITFSGNAAQVQAAFGTTPHHYQIDGEVHLAPNSNLTLPADLAAITTAVLHLSDFRPRPMAHPVFTAASNGKHYLTPTDLEVMYDLPYGNDADHTSGSGQAIAIIGQSYVDTSGSARFRSFGTNTTTLSLSGVLVPNTGVEAISPGDAAETEIDLEYAGGIAPEANIFLVHVGSDPNYGAFDALAFSIDQNLAPVVSISYSECETFLSTTEVQQGNALFQQAAAQGQTLIAASGDSGSTACAPNSVSSFLSATQQQALAVDYPADSPYVTAVGGTQMAAGTFDSNNTTYWSPAPIVGFDLIHSLLSYVPEVAWNEDSVSSIFAGGGGASTAYARPSWQSGFPGIPQGATRLLPDIALQASRQNPGFLLCTDDVYFLAGEGQLYGCQGGLLADNKQYTVGGGTSFAAPVFAAMTALINQSQHSVGQGNVNPTLYRLASSSAIGSSVFHDVTSGSIACVSGNPRCSAAGQSGFAAAPGYDQATGLGSVDYAHLLAAWPATAFASHNATTTVLYPFYSSTSSGTLDTHNHLRPCRHSRTGRYTAHRDRLGLRRRRSRQPCPFLRSNRPHRLERADKLQPCRSSYPRFPPSRRHLPRGQHAWPVHRHHLHPRRQRPCVGRGHTVHGKRNSSRQRLRIHNRHRDPLWRIQRPPLLVALALRTHGQRPRRLLLHPVAAGAGYLLHHALTRHRNRLLLHSPSRTFHPSQPKLLEIRSHHGSRPSLLPPPSRTSPPASAAFYIAHRRERGSDRLRGRQE